MNQPHTLPTVGIDDMALYLPKLYFDIQDLAAERGIEYDKLSKGLGLLKMAQPDAHEDTATMAANAIARLIDRNQLDPRHIGRIYLGTESALDGSKPTASYALGMLEAYYAPRYGAACFQHCDVVDLTFACIGGVDAMQNTLDWVANDSRRMGIVVSADNAKYELNSSGEYTQGAGAVAVLLKQQPRLLTIHREWGVGTKSVHDFFKPKRFASKAAILQEVFDLIAYQNGSLAHYLDRLSASLEVNGILDANEAVLQLHKETPVFDGHYSNKCYQDRIAEAFAHFKTQLPMADAGNAIDRWAGLVFHLPYAFHAKRVFTDIFISEHRAAGTLAAIEAQVGAALPQRTDVADEKSYQKALDAYTKAIAGSAAYRALVKQKIEKGQRASSEVGNMYTASIFLALMSTLHAEMTDHTDLAGKRLGFLAYGSGSKAKVFEGTVNEGWREVVRGFGLAALLADRQRIDYATYYRLHTGTQATSVLPAHQTFVLQEVETTKGVTEGARSYHWSEKLATVK